jgi:hypothetical protein
MRDLPFSVASIASLFAFSALAAAPLQTPPRFVTTDGGTTIEFPQPVGAALQGKANDALGGVEVVNTTDAGWTDCQLRLADGRWFDIPAILPKGKDSVIFARFNEPAAEKVIPDDRVHVKCDQGEDDFLYNDINAAQKLKGYAEKKPLDAVTIHNTTDTTWERCTVTRPDGSKHVLGRVKAKDKETVGFKLFQGANTPQRPDVKIVNVAIQCKQGYGLFPIKNK